MGGMHKVVADIVTQLKPYQPEKIILFGSYAYGKPHEDSDVDLVIIKKTNEPFLERFKRARSLIRTQFAVDLFIFTPEEFEAGRKNNILMSEIAKKGKVIYG